MAVKLVILDRDGVINHVSDDYIEISKGYRIIGRVLASDTHKNTTVFNDLVNFVDTFIENGGALV